MALHLSSGVYLGIDAGYSKTVRSTGICVLRPGTPKPIVAVRVWADETLQAVESILAGDIPTAIGIDAPLVPIEGKALYRLSRKYRECERHLSGGVFQKRCKPGPTNSPRGYALHRQATKVANVLATQFEGSPISEAFPNAFLGVMLPDKVFCRWIPRGKKSDEFWAHCFISQGSMWKLLPALFGRDAREIFYAARLVTNHDERAAVVCALTARCAHAGIGSPCTGQDGEIILPPAGFIQPWAKDHLRKNGLPIPA